MVDRVIVYTGQVPLGNDFLNAQKNTMIALGMAFQAVLGTATLVDGLACTPTGPASMQVLVAPGSIMAVENVDGTAYGNLAADTTHQIVKQGIVLGTTTLTLTAPSTTGFSINYLVQAAYQDVDTGSTVLPYFNAANPPVAFNGPSNTGVSQNTIRQGQCVISLKAGTAATTGTQTTPAADAGFTALWVVTVANGATTVTSGNIAKAGGAPFISEKLGDKVSIPTGDARWAPIGGGTFRTRLTNTANYYVATTGNDSNPGTSGSPWLTIQHALNYIQQSIDLGGFTATINVADGTYTGSVLLFGPFTGGEVILQGDTGNPANCIISTTSANGISLGGNSFLTLGGGFSLQTTTSGDGIAVDDNSYLKILGPMNYGACAGNHINVFGGSQIFIDGNETISAGAATHLNASQRAGIIKSSGMTTTLSGTPAFTTFVNCVNQSYIEDTGTTYSGSATGTRFAVASNAAINTNGGGANYYPGNSAGTGTNAGTAPYGLYL
jgi:hypothetical protein